MAESYAGRMAKFLSPEVLARTHAVPAQQSMFKRYADIFGKTGVSSDPIAQVGALDMRQGDMRHDPGSSPFYGVTYYDNLLPSELAETNPEEQAMIARSGYNIGNLRNRIILSPEAVAGEAVATVPHELGHRGMNLLGYPQDSWGQDDESMLRIISVMRGEDLQGNLEYMNKRFPREDGRNWTQNMVRSKYEPDIAVLQRAATDYLRQRGLK